MTNNTNPPQNTTNHTWHLRHLSWPQLNVLRVRLHIFPESQFGGCSLWRTRPNAVRKVCVLHGPGKPEPGAIKRDGVAYGGCRAASLTVLALSPTHFRRKKAGPQFISEYAGARRIHLVKRGLRSLESLHLWTALQRWIWRNIAII